MDKLDLILLIGLVAAFLIGLIRGFRGRSLTKVGAYSVGILITLAVSITIHVLLIQKGVGFYSDLYSKLSPQLGEWTYYIMYLIIAFVVSLVVILLGTFFYRHFWGKRLYIFTNYLVAYLGMSLVILLAIDLLLFEKDGIASPNEAKIFGWFFEKVISNVLGAF
jgi:hypothetical protein